MTRKNANAATGDGGARQKVSFNRNVPANTEVAEAAQILPIDQIRVGERHRRDLGDINRSDLLSVYDGCVCCGHVARGNKLGHEAFDVAGRSLGIFRTITAAANAISDVFVHASAMNADGRHQWK